MWQRRTETRTCLPSLHEQTTKAVLEAKVAGKARAGLVSAVEAGTTMAAVEETAPATVAAEAAVRSACER